MSVINTNVKALYTQAAMKISGREGATAMEQLSTGKRINSAKDDAAGMAIADRMTQQIRSLNMAVRNAGDAISLIQTAEGATNEITDMLQRMRELSIQAINDTNTGEQRGYLDLEFQQLKQEIVRISDTTEWNGYPLLNGTNGVAQGEQPVYKVQSTPDTLTAPVAVGTDKAIVEPIEQQLMTFTNAEPHVETLTFVSNLRASEITLSIPGESAIVFEVASTDTSTQVAAKAVTAINGTAAFVNRGRLAVDNGDGTVGIRYAAAEGSVLTTTSATFDPTSDATATSTQTVAYVQNTAWQETLAFGAAGTPSPGIITVTGGGVAVNVPVEPGDTGTSLAVRTVDVLNADAAWSAVGTASVSAAGSVLMSFLAQVGAATPGNAAVTTGVTRTVATAAITTPTPYVAATTAEIQVISFTNTTPVAGKITLNFDGGLNIDVAVLAGDTNATLGTRTLSTLNANATFVANGWSAAAGATANIVNVTYALAYGDPATVTLTVPLNAASTGTTGGGNITVGGETVAVTAGDTKEVIAAKVVTALKAGVFVTGNAGRMVTDNTNGSINVTYNRVDADIADTSFVDTGTTGTTATVAAQVVARTTTTFAGTGAFEKSGELVFSVAPETAEVQKIAFGPSAASQTIVVGGVNVPVVANDTAETVAFKVKAALDGNAAFAVASGRTITNNGDGSLSITFAVADGDVAPITYADNATPTGVTASIFTPTNYGSVSATYDVDDGETVTLSGTVNAANGTVTFAKANVAQVDTITLGGTAVANNVLKLTIGNLSYSYTTASAVQSTEAVAFVAGINADRNLSNLVTAAYTRTGSITLTAKNAGTPFTAHTTVTRPVNGGTATIASSNTTANVTAGNNSLVISDDLTVTMLGADGLSENINLRAPGVTVSVARAYPALAQLSASDLIINGVTVGPSLAEDDTVSVSNNAGGALAKAAAINRVKDLSGVQAVVSEAVLTGTAMVSGAAVTGTLTLNGFTSPVLTTVLDDTRLSRANTVEAINRMTARTGVVATDTGSDEKGIRLEAADGRNIEVFFNTASVNTTFAERTGLREGLTTGSIALESKVEAPVILTSTGDITKVGFVAGDYSANKTSVANSDRAVASPPTAQISSIDVTGTIVAGDEFTITLNGRSKTVVAVANSTAKTVIDALISAVANDSVMATAVTASKGLTHSQIHFTSKVAGTEFTATASTTTTNGYIDVATVRANASASNVKLNTGDLVLNGIAVPGSTSSGDIRSTTGVLSGQTDSSGISIAAAINSITKQTGITADVKPARIVGTTTTTGAPAVFPETGIQSLYINGIEVEVNLTEDEPADTRRENVLAAINRKLDSHGVSATNNGTGLTLTSSDGRNVSVWFNSSVAGLSPSSFGLSAGDEVAQSSTLTIANAITAPATVTFKINGVSLTTATIPATVAAPANSTAIAAAVKAAVDTGMNNGSLTNLTVSVLNGAVTIQSTIPGSGFTINGADSSTGLVQMAIATPRANSLGGSAVTGIWGGSVTSDSALTLYSSVELTSDSEFTVAAGTNGYADPTHWKNLGFTEGSFGGKSSVEMSPPRVGRMTFQVGATSNQIINVDFADFGKGGPITSGITGDVELWDQESRVNRIDNRDAATAVLNKLDAVLDKVNATRATMGAVMNRLEHVIDNLMNVSINTEASRSQIEDADYASASTELARTQIMQQAATAILAQANADQQGVLKLLQ
jgi:flagellin